jgi:hypothetical protein
MDSRDAKTPQSVGPAITDRIAETWRPPLQHLSTSLLLVSASRVHIIPG